MSLMARSQEFYYCGFPNFVWPVLFFSTFYAKAFLLPFFN